MNTPTYFTPAEVSSLFRSYIERAKKNDIMWVRGIYFPKTKQSDKYTFAIDELQDKDNDCSIKLLVADGIRRQLVPGSLVAVGGVLEPYLFSNGTISVQLRVTRVETLQEHPVSDDDLRRAALARTKAEQGYKAVDAHLERVLYDGNRKPRVALIFAQTSITADDFRAGAGSAVAQIDFDELRLTFTPKALADYLRQIDAEGYDAIALIRGGGSGLDALDAPEVLEAVARMQTPTIAAVGHAADQLFVKTLADKTVATPTDLGHYFAAIVEHITEVRTHSRAVLVEEVRKQYAQQLAEADKKNAALLQRVDTLTRSQQDTARGFATQSQALQQRLDQAQRRAHELETQMAARRTPTLLYVVIALVAALVGFVLHIVVA